MKLKSLFFLIFFCENIFSFAQLSQNEIKEEHDKKLEDYEGNLVEYSLSKCFMRNLQIKNSNYPYEYTDGIFYFDTNSEYYDLCKNTNLILSTSFLWNSDTRYLGNESKINFQFFYIFGLKAENIIFPTDDSYEGKLKLGMFIPILKFDYLSYNISTTWSFLYDEDYVNGVFVGFEFKSFPIKPIVLEFDVGEHFFSDDTICLELNAEIGFFLKSVEFFFQYKYAKEHIFGLGAICYF